MMLLLSKMANRKNLEGVLPTQILIALLGLVGGVHIRVLRTIRSFSAQRRGSDNCSNFLVLLHPEMFQMDDLVELHAEGQEEIDADLLDKMLDEETQSLKELEGQALLYRQQEEARKKLIILDKLNRLQAARDRKSVLNKVLSGELPPSALDQTQQQFTTPVQSPATGARGQPRGTFNLAASAPRLRTQEPPAATGVVPNANGEYKDIFSSLMQLQHGNLGPFASLMSTRQNSSMANLPELGSTARKNLKFESRPTVLNHANQHNVGIDNNLLNSVNAENQTFKVTSMPGQSTVNAPVMEAPVNAKTSQKGVNAKEEGDSDNSEGDPDKGKTKKKKSGILSKPDESDIIKTVRFPHELLDDRHVKGCDKIFSKLTFPQLCAGELEVVARLNSEADSHEIKARLEILTTLCYHSAYLDISELKAQYDATMKRVERGAAQWTSNLADRLHHDLAFRAGVLVRENKKKSKSSSDSSKAQSQVSEQKVGGGIGGVKSNSKLPTEVKMHYCQDYNKGSCIHPDNHEGKIGNRDVTLFHFCKRCLLSSSQLKRAHPETDVNCPSRI